MYLENIKIAIKSIKSNLLRSMLTILIIMVGITALVGILTAIDTILFSLNDNFSSVGSNSFKIRPANADIHSNGPNRDKEGDPIIFRQAQLFKDKYHFPGTSVSIFANFFMDATVKYGTKKTNPNISIMGIDDNYVKSAKIEIDKGRYFNSTELDEGLNKVIMGHSIFKSLFPETDQNPINKVVDINGFNYKIIGVLKEAGQNRNSDSDKSVFIPVMNGKKYYQYEDLPYNINIGMENSINMDDAISSATAIFRNIRGLNIKEANDFEITKSDNLLKMLKDATFKIRIATIAIALITLIGAAIGLMNIMLVTVAERTREIGIRKSIGATNGNILTQFLTESVIISQLGGILGIILGVAIGIIIAQLIKGHFHIPWAWILLALAINTIVGLLSGVFPAVKAAKLDPIESLRYE